MVKCHGTDDFFSTNRTCFPKEDHPGSRWLRVEGARRNNPAASLFSKTIRLLRSLPGCSEFLRGKNFGRSTGSVVRSWTYFSVRAQRVWMVRSMRSIPSLALGNPFVGYPAPRFLRLRRSSSGAMIILLPPGASFRTIVEGWK